MVLFAVTGELGAGKTLSLTFLAWHNWFNKGRRIFSNYNLYGIPFTKVNSIPRLEDMQSGFFAGDELWLWIDSWQGKSKKSGVVASILLKSRKRDITIAYSTQTIGQVTPRIRNVNDFVAYPIMSPNGYDCKVIIMRGGNKPVPINKPPLYFNCESVYAMYNTREEIDAIDEKSRKPLKEEFFNVYENKVFINDYVKKIVGLKDENKIKRFCDIVQKTINPDDYRTEKERKDKVEVMSAI